ARPYQDAATYDAFTRTQVDHADADLDDLVDLAGRRLPVPAGRLHVDDEKPVLHAQDGTQPRRSPETSFVGGPRHPLRHRCRLASEWDGYLRCFTVTHHPDGQ